MSRDICRPISRQALGRTAFLGSLYDATTDEFCERSIVNDDIPSVAIRTLDENHGHSSYEFDTSVSKKLRKLNVDASLSLSILGGLVKSVGASSNYLYTRDKTNQSLEATFLHRSITRTESLNVSHKEVKTRVEPTALRHKSATHIVTSIRWGADVFVQLEASSSIAESKHVAKAGLKLELNKLLSKFISVNPNNSFAVPVDAVKSDVPNTTESSDNTAKCAQIDSGSTAPQLSFESTSTKTVFSYKITLFGDLIPTTCPKNIEELLDMLPTIMAGLQKTNNGKGRPLEYIMLPISELAEILGEELTSDRIFRALEDSLAHEIQSVFDEADELRTTVQTLYTSMQQVDEFFQEEEMNKIAVYRHDLIHMQRNIRERIGNLLIQVRSGKAEACELERLLVEFESQVAAKKAETKELKHSDTIEKLKYALELKEKDVIPIRGPENLSILQNQHPKHRIIVLYTSNEMRQSSKTAWIKTYFEFLHHMENPTSNVRFLYCYFDYDLHPNFQPQEKQLEVRQYVDINVPVTNTHIKAEKVVRQGSANGIEVLLKSVNSAAATSLAQWREEAKARIKEIFAQSGSRVLLPYVPQLTTRNEIFGKLRSHQKNILLVGRSQVGKSTFKTVLANPTQIPDMLTSSLKTEFPLFEQYTVRGTETILNFIDTPGLFQRTRSSSTSPDNGTIIQLIHNYIRSKIAELHFVCFFTSLETTVNQDDLQTIRTIFDLLGPEVRKNACLVITKSESKSETELEFICKDAENNLDFKILSSQMKQGVFFSGSLNQENWLNTSDCVYEQFKRACQYRNKLLDLFIDADIKPIDLTTQSLGKKMKTDISSKNS